MASSFTRFKGELLNATSLLFECCQCSNVGQLFSPEPLWQFCSSLGRVHRKVTVVFMHLSAPRGFCCENVPVKLICETRSWLLHRVCTPLSRWLTGRVFQYKDAGLLGFLYSQQSAIIASPNQLCQRKSQRSLSCFLRSHSELVSLHVKLKKQSLCCFHFQFA